jgi:hypothetical protein
MSRLKDANSTQGETSGLGFGQASRSSAGKLRFETFKVFRVPSPIPLDIAIYC